MIARIWRGWTLKGDADTYEKILRTKVFPSLEKIDGYLGGYVMRADKDDEVEFVVENFFDTIEDIKKFAGEEYEVAVFEPEARKVLSKVEPIARHYTVKMDSVTGQHHQ